MAICFGWIAHICCIDKLFSKQYIFYLRISDIFTNFAVEIKWKRLRHSTLILSFWRIYFVIIWLYHINGRFFVTKIHIFLVQFICGIISHILAFSKTGFVGVRVTIPPRYHPVRGSTLQIQTVNRFSSYHYFKDRLLYLRTKKGGKKPTVSVLPSSTFLYKFSALPVLVA